MSEAYDNYLSSDYWKSVSSAVKHRAGYRCQVCNSPHDLQAHHRSYAHRGRELDHLDDLTCLCRRCHGVFHGKLETPKPVERIIERVVIQEVTRPPADLTDTVFITHENKGKIRDFKPAWHWLKDNGIDPTRSGWRKRAIGRFVPRAFMR